MVKPLTMTISVEETFFGKIYRMLDTMPGVASIAIHSEGVKANGAAKPKKKQGGTQSAHCLVLGALVKSPGITKAQLVPVLEGNGKKATTLPDTITKLKKAKHIAVKGSGKAATFTITAAGKKHFDTACEIEQGAA